MKAFIAIFALFAVAAAQQQYQEKPIAILRQSSDISPEGTYNYVYETENGISHSENGAPNAQGPDGTAAVTNQGQYSYTGPDNVQYTVQYVANENGFQPQGAHLPVAPAIPELIQKSLAYIQQNVQGQLASNNNNQFIRPAATPFRRF